MKTEDEVDFLKDRTEEAVSAHVVTLSFAVLYKETPLLLWPAGFLSVACAKLSGVQWCCFSLLKIAWAFLALAFSTAGLRHIYVFSAGDREIEPRGSSWSKVVPRFVHDLTKAVSWNALEDGDAVWGAAAPSRSLHCCCRGGPGESLHPFLCFVFPGRFWQRGLWLWLLLVCAQTLRSKGIMGWECLCLSWKKNE